MTIKEIDKQLKICAAAYAAYEKSTNTDEFHKTQEHHTFVSSAYGFYRPTLRQLKQELEDGKAGAEYCASLVTDCNNLRYELKLAVAEAEDWKQRYVNSQRQWEKDEKSEHLTRVIRGLGL